MAFIAPTLAFPRPLRGARPAQAARHARHRTPLRRQACMTAAPATNIESAWPPFAEKMRATGEVPPLADWHTLLDIARSAGDDAPKAIWVVNLMRETGVSPTAVTYEKVLRICAERDDRAAAFHLVEHMFEDKVLLGDVELPDGMEDMLRKILPPEAFE